MSYATLLWGVFQVHDNWPAQRLIAIASSKSEAKAWQRDNAAGRRTRVRRLQNLPPGALCLQDRASIAVAELRQLTPWRRIPARKRKGQ